MILLDVVSLLVAIWASYALRLSDWSPVITPERITLAILATVVAIPVFHPTWALPFRDQVSPRGSNLTILKAMMIVTTCWLSLSFCWRWPGKGSCPARFPSSSSYLVPF